MGNLEAKGERSVVVGRDVINSIIVTGDHNSIFAGKYETLSESYIYPQEFEQVDLEHFVGRKWLLDMVDSFLLNHDRGYFIIEAGAGFGKTTFMAWLVKKRHYIHNFCGAAPGPDKTGNGLKNLVSQLVLAYKLCPEGVLNSDVASRSDYLYSKLVKASEQRINNEKIVLVIDALDEAGTLKGQNVMGLPKSLPEGVFIIASQRPGVKLNIDTTRIPRIICRLSDHKEEHEEDIRYFLYDVTNSIKRPKIASFLRDRGYTPEEFVTILIKKSQGVWIYLHCVISAIELNEWQTLDLDSLPVGLRDYYIGYWMKWSEEDQWFKSYSTLLATLAVAQEPISIERLTSWTSSEMLAPELRRLLMVRWGPYMAVSLHGKEERYSFYHPTLKEFFEGIVEQENLNTDEKVFLDALIEAAFDAHNRLVERYLTAWGGLNNGLPGLQNPDNLAIEDGYGLRYLAPHLEASGRVNDLHLLLALETANQRNAWYEAKDAYGTVADYMADVARAWLLAENVSESMIKKGEIAQTIGLEIRYALISASINSLLTNIPPELLVALVEKGIWTLNKGLAYARQIPNWVTRMKVLILILNLPKSQLLEAEREEIIKGLLDEAIKIQNADSRSWVLVRIVPHLPESMREEALKEAFDATIKIENIYDRAKALVEIAPNLPESMMKEALNAAIQIQDDSEKAEALAGIAPNLPESVRKEALREALDKVSKIQNDSEKARVLARIAPNLPESMRKEALEIAIKIQDESARAGSLVELALNLPESMKTDILHAAITIQNDFLRAYVMAGIASYLPESLIKEAFDTIIVNRGLSGWDTALVRLVPNLPECMKKEAFDAVIKNQYLFGWDTALVGLASQMPESIRKEAFDAATQIKDIHVRARVLAGIAPTMPESMMTEAFDTAIKIKDELERAYAFVGIAPNLPEPLKTKIFDEATKINDEYSKAYLLAGIAPYLPESMMREAWDIATKIQDERFRTEAFVGIAPYLPESMTTETFDAATQIQEERLRAVALAGIAPYLPESMMREAFKEALEVAVEIEEEWLRAEALVGIAPYLPKSMIKEAINAAAQIQDEYYKAEALAETVPNLPESMMREAWDIAIEIQDEYYKAEALAGIAPNLPESMTKEALEIAIEIEDEEYKAKALVGIAPNLPESKMKEVLEIVIEIQDEHYKAKALAGIAPYLPEPMMKEALKEALNAAIQIKYKFKLGSGNTAETLAEIAPNLPESMIKELLDAVMQIQEDSEQAEALAGVASFFVNSSSLDLLYDIWMKILHGSTSSRKELFTNIGKITPIIYKLGEEKALNETFYAIQDVTRWWP